MVGATLSEGFLVKSRTVKTALSPIHTCNNVEATFDFVETTFDPVAKFHRFDKVETN